MHAINKSQSPSNSASCTVKIPSVQNSHPIIYSPLTVINKPHCNSPHTVKSQMIICTTMFLYLASFSIDVNSFRKSSLFFECLSFSLETELSQAIAPNTSQAEVFVSNRVVVLFDTARKKVSHRKSGKHTEGTAQSEKIFDEDATEDVKNQSEPRLSKERKSLKRKSSSISNENEAQHMLKKTENRH